MIVLSRAVSADLYCDFLETCESYDDIARSMRGFAEKVRECGGEVCFIDVGGFEVQFSTEQDQVLFLLKWSVK